FACYLLSGARSILPLWNDDAAAAEHYAVVSDQRHRDSVTLGSPPLQHPGHAQILVDTRPMNTHWHNLEIRTLLISRRLKARIPMKGRCNLSTITQRDDKLGCRELDRSGTQITDVQSTHARPLPHYPLSTARSILPS